MQIPEAKLDKNISCERLIKPSLFFDVSKVWLKELIKFWQDFMLEHDILKLFFLYFKRIFDRLEKEVNQCLTNFFRRIEQGHLFKFKLHEVLFLKMRAFLA